MDYVVYFDFHMLNLPNVAERYSHGVGNGKVRSTSQRGIFGTKNVKCCTDIWTGKTNNFFTI